MSAAAEHRAAVLQALPPGEPLRLDDSTGAWTVMRGQAQVFAVVRDDADAPEGQRWHLGSVGPGGLLLGAALPPDAWGDGLLTTGQSGTELRQLDLERPGVEAEPDVAAAAQGWVALLAAGFGRGLGPRPRLDTVLAPGASVAVSPGATAGAMQDGVWVEIAGGTVALFGMVSVSGLLPLPMQAWLVPEGPAEITVLTARDALARPGWVDGLRAATAACLDTLPLLRGLTEADELNRLRLRRDLDGEAEAETRAAMARILRDPAPPRTGAAGARADDGLFEVMTRVAWASGLVLRRPDRVREADLERLPEPSDLVRASNLRLRRVRLDGRWWRRDLGPLLGRQRSEPVALLPGPDGYRLADAAGNERPLTPALAAELDAAAFCLIGPFPDAGFGLGDLLRFGLGGAKREIGVLAAALLGGAVLGQAVPLAVGLAFALLIPGGLSGAMAQLAVALLVVAGIGYAVQVGQEAVRQRVEARAAWAGQAALWDRILRLPLPQLRRFAVGDLTARANSATTLPAASRGLALAAASSVAMLLSSGVTMLLHHPWAALLAFGLTAVQLLAAMLAGWRQGRAFADGTTLTGLTDALLFQLVNGIAKLRLAGAEDRAFRRWAVRFAAMRARSVKARAIAYAHDCWLVTSAAFGMVALYALIALLDRRVDGVPRTDLSDIMAFLASFALHAAAAGGLAHAILGAWMQAPAWRSARPLLAAVPEPASGRADPGRLSGAIEIANLRFAYAGATEPVFAGISARIEPGEFVAVTGRSGAGKTTLLRLLLGLENPTGGGIAYDGQELSLLDLTALRRQVASVLQNGRLPPGTLLQAVRGLSDAGEEEIWEALRAAAVADDVAAMPMRLGTMLTDGSRTLSGGQVQRLLVARALLQRPAILLLDEATSALDTATEAAVSRALAQLPATRIVIAHRLSTIRRADRILYLDGGLVAESGTFDQLVAAGSGFARLVAAG